MIGFLEKMKVVHSDPVDYYLRLDDQEEYLNPHIGARMRLIYHGRIRCRYCSRGTRRSYGQGYCYPCFKKLARCDLCVVSPTRCHYSEGTCREPEWGEQFCMQPHLVYLANSSGLKVGITRPDHLPTRWIDQGAVQAVPILAVQTRQQAGFVEAVFRNHVGDTTHWQRMLKADGPHVDIEEARDRLIDRVGPDLQSIRNRFGTEAIQLIRDARPEIIRYPVRQYPTRVVSIKFDKTPHIQGTLLGMKGQYLIFDCGVINLRRFTSYEVELAL